MEKKNMAKRNVLQMSLGNNKNPMNITVGGHDKNVEISFNSKNNKNIWIPTSSITGRRFRQCCLHKHRVNEIMLTFPENGRLLVPNGLPLVIESQYIQNFKAAFYSPQLLDNDTESMRETVSCSPSDYSGEIKDKKQCPALEKSDRLSKEEQKKYSLMKQIHTLKRSLGKIGEALKEIGEYQADILKEENERNHNLDPITDKCKIKRSVKPYKYITSRKSDKHLTRSKSEKYLEEIDSLNQITTITPVGKASQGKRKTDALPTVNKVLDHPTIKKQAKQEDKPRRRNNHISKHSVREDDFASAEKTNAKLVDNMKSTQLLLNEILQQDQIITDSHVEDASQIKIKTIPPPAGNKVLHHVMMEEEAKPRRKENMIDSHSIIEDDFASAGKTLSKSEDNRERSKLMADDILPLDQIVTDTPVVDYSQTKIKTVAPSVGNKVLDHAVTVEQEVKPRRKENANHSVREDGFDSSEERTTELADNVKRSKLIVNGIVHPYQNQTDTFTEEASQRKTDSLSAGNKILDHSTIEKQTKQEDKPQRKESQIDNFPVIENDFASDGETAADFEDTVKSSRLMLNDILQREKSMNVCKKKYIQEVEALCQDQQRLLEGIFRIYGCSNLASSEECTLEQTSADQQQDFENKADKDSKFRSDFEETSEAGTRTYKSSSMPVIGNILKKQNLKEQLALKNVQLEKLIKEIQLLKTNRIIEAGKEKSGLMRQDRQIQETAAETSRGKTANDEGTSTNSNILVKEVTGIISYTNEILKGERCEGNIYETTLTHRVKKIPSIIDESKYVELSNKEYIEALSDAQTAMRKLEATFQKLIPVLPKISQQHGVCYYTPTTVSHYEENSSGKILKGQKLELSNGSEKVSKDKTKRHVETQTSSTDEMSRRQYVECIQEDREREQSDSEEFSPSETTSGEHVSSAETIKKSKGVVSAEIESQRLKKSKDSSKTEISSHSRTVPKRLESNKGSMEYEFKDDIFDEEFLENERGSVKTIKIPDYSLKTEKQFTLPSAVSRKHFNQYLDDMPQPFQPRHSSMESTRINYYQESAQQAHGSSSHKDPINFRRYSSIVSKPDEEKMIHLPDKSPVNKSHGTYNSESDSVFLPKKESGIQHETEKGSLSDDSVEISEETEPVIPTEHAKQKSDVIDEETKSSISKYEIEPSERKVGSYSGKNNTLISDVIEEGSIPQYELELFKENDRRKSNEDRKFRNNTTEGRSIYNISQYELEPPKEDRRKSNDDIKCRRDITEERTIFSISPYELEQHAQNRRNWNKPNKHRSDVIEEGSIASISQYELEEPQEQDRRISGERAVCNSNEHSRSWYVPDEYVGSTLSEPDSEEFNKNEEVNRRDICKQKSNNSQQGHISSNEKFRSWYVPEYFEYSGSEPDSREFDQIEEGSISEISKHKLNNSQESPNLSNQKSRSRYAPEYVGSSLREPSSKEFSQIDGRCMSDISNYKTEQLRALDLSNYNRRKSLPVYEDRCSPNPQRIHRLNTYAGFPLSDTSTLTMPNIPLRCQPNTSSSESQRGTFLEKVSLEFSSNKQNSRECSLPYAFNYETQKTAGTKPKDRPMTDYSVLGNARKQNVTNETPYRDFPHFNESMNQSDAPLPYPECSRKSCDRTFNKPLLELQHYRDFGSLEIAISLSPSRTNEDKNRRQTFHDYNQMNKIRKLYDEIMNNPK